MTGAATLAIIIGIVVGLVSSLIQSLGLTLQRRSHVQNEEVPPDQQRPFWQRPRWLVGFLVFISANFFGSIFQIAALPIVILAPLGAISLLWNAIFARLILGDVFSAFMGIGTMQVASGAVLIGVFGVVPTPSHSIDDMIVLFGRAAFIGYFVPLLSITMILLVFTHGVEWTYRTRLRQAFINASAPLSLPDEHTGLLTPSPSPWKSFAGTRLFLALSYAVLAGTLSAFGLLLAKAGVELVVLTLSGENQFWRWQAWVLLPFLAFFGLSQLWYLQKALLFADPTLVCPLSFCCFNIFSILDSLVYFDQFRLLSHLQLWMIILGTLLLLSGVWLLSLQSARGVKLADSAAGAVMSQTAMITDSPAELDESELDDDDYPSSPMSPLSPILSLLTPAAEARSPHPLPAGFTIGFAPTSPGFILSPPKPKRRTLMEERSVPEEPEAVEPPPEREDSEERPSSQGETTEKWWKPWSRWNKKA